jgi:hypothetical protein
MAACDADVLGTEEALRLIGGLIVRDQPRRGRRVLRLG